MIPRNSPQLELVMVLLLLVWLVGNILVKAYS